MPKLKVTSEFNTKGFKKGAEESKDIFGDLAQSAKSNLGGKAKAAAGAFVAAFAFDAIVGGISEVISATADMARELDEVSSKLGTTASQTRALILGLKGDAGAAEGSIASLVTKIAEASDGNQAAIDDFARLGLTVKDFDGQSMVQQFGTMVQAMQDFGKSNDTMATAARLLGEDGVKQYDNMTNSLGAWKDETNVAFDDSIKRASELSFQMQTLKEDVLITLFDGLKPLTDAMVENQDVIRDVAQATADLIVFLPKLAKGFSNIIPSVYLSRKAIELFAGSSIEGFQKNRKAIKESNKALLKNTENERAAIRIQKIKEVNTKRLNLTLKDQVGFLDDLNKKLEEKKIRTQKDVAIDKLKLASSKDYVQELQKEITEVEASNESAVEKEKSIRNIIDIQQKELEKIKELQTTLSDTALAAQKAEDIKKKAAEDTAKARIKFEEDVAKKMAKASEDEIKKVMDLKKSIQDILKPEDNKKTKEKFGIQDIEKGSANNQVFEALGKAAREGATLDELKIIAETVKEQTEAGEDITKVTKQRLQDAIDMSTKLALTQESIQAGIQKQEELKAKETQAIADALAGGKTTSPGGQVKSQVEVLEEANSLQGQIFEELVKQTASLQSMDGKLQTAKVTIS